MMSDPIADCFARIRNASSASHDSVRMMYSRMKESIVKILKDEGLISDFEVSTEGGKKYLTVHLRYEDSGKPMIQKLKRLSKPGQRMYRSAPKKLEVRSGLGFQILSTSKGLMTDREAIEKKIGGELVAEIW